MEHSGLAYQQHGVDYQNPHYDVSFVLKDLNPDEFRHLQTMVGQNVEKIRAATADTYQNLPFTASEYEQLKKALGQHKQYWLTSFFYTSPVNAIMNKLKFDFKSLIAALNTYMTNYDRWNDHNRQAAWLDVGKAQRDVPVHIANEYCRPDRSFDPCPTFDEPALPRVLLFYNYSAHVSSAWFPLTSSSSGLGFDFGLFRGRPVALGCRARGPGGRGGLVARQFGAWGATVFDLEAVSRLDEVRTADLTLSREVLDVAAMLTQPWGRYAPEPVLFVA